MRKKNKKISSVREKHDKFLKSTNCCNLVCSLYKVFICEFNNSIILFI